MLLLAIRIAHTLFVGVLVPIYWHYYGAQNFLWFSDIALIASVVALWSESRVLASMQALSVTALELGWTIDLLGRLLFGGQLFGLSGYMFDPTYPLFLRRLSFVPLA